MVFRGFTKQGLIGDVGIFGNGFAVVKDSDLVGDLQVVGETLQEKDVIVVENQMSNHRYISRRNLFYLRELYYGFGSRKSIIHKLPNEKLSELVKTILLRTNTSTICMVVVFVPQIFI